MILPTINIILGAVNLYLGIREIKDNQKVLGVCGIIIGSSGLLSGILSIISAFGGV